MKAITLIQRMDTNLQYREINTPLIQRKSKKLISVERKQMSQ